MMRTTCGYRFLFLRVSAALALAGCLGFPLAHPSWGQDAGAPPSPGKQADVSLQSAVTQALAADSSLEGQQITASASGGIVTLTGTVATNQQRQAAETDVANVEGVSAIQNSLSVTNPSAPPEGQSPAQGNQQAAPSDEEAPPPPDEPDQPTTPQQPAAAPSYPEQPQATGPAAGNPPPPPPPDQNPSARPPYQPQGGYQQQPYNQGGYQQQPYNQRGYQQQPYSQPGYQNYPQPISGPVTLPAGTLLQVRTSQPVDLNKVQPGMSFDATAASDVYEGDVLAIPRGARVVGTIVSVAKSGSLGGHGEVQLQITSVWLGGRMYPVTTDIWSSQSPNKAGYTARNTAGGAILGAIIGGIAGGGPAAAAGAIVGGGAGMATSAATNPRNYLPPEMLLNFHLSTPATVQPVSWQEAQRLAQNAPPQLQRRPVYMAPPYPYPWGYPYPYPYAYYRIYGW